MNRVDWTVLLVLAGATCSARADDAVVLSKEQMVERHPELRLESIKDSPVGGLYEVTVGGAITYVSVDGRFQLRGDIIDIDARRNLTEARRAEHRAAVLAAMEPAGQIVFAPSNGIVKHRLTVFTDVDCGYCRQLHRDIETITALGIEVHYVAYPRTGPNTESWKKAERVWCAADRHAALTRAKLGGDIPAMAGCTSTPVATQYEIGRNVGVTGTPAVYAETGRSWAATCRRQRYSRSSRCSRKLANEPAAHLQRLKKPRAYAT